MLVTETPRHLSFLFFFFFFCLAVLVSVIDINDLCTDRPVWNVIARNWTCDPWNVLTEKALNLIALWIYGIYGIYKNTSNSSIADLEFFFGFSCGWIYCGWRWNTICIRLVRKRRVWERNLWDFLDLIFFSLGFLRGGVYFLEHCEGIGGWRLCLAPCPCCWHWGFPWFLGHCKFGWASNSFSFGVILGWK